MLKYRIWYIDCFILQDIMFVVKKRIIKNLVNICEKRNLEELDILQEDFYIGDED